MKTILKTKKIFHGLVNYGTQAGFLAKGLRDAGYEALSVSTSDNYKRLIDIELDYNGGFFKRKFKSLGIYFKKIKWFFQFDIFHFYYGQTLFPYNLDLYFYKFFKKKIIMEYLGHDIDLCLGMNGLDYRNRVCNRLKKVKRIEKQRKLVNKQLVCAPYYYQFVNNSIILPLAIDIDEYSYTTLNPNYKCLTIMHCPTNRVYKKSDIIEAALDKLKKEGYEFNYKCVTNVTHEKLKEEYMTSDIIIDQLNPWYGTVSIEAMALGRPVVCGYQRHLMFYDYEKYNSLPIINADIYNIYQVLKDLLDKKYDLVEIGKTSRKFVEKTHDLKKVTKDLIKIYESL